MRADKFFAEKFGSRTKASVALARGLVVRNGKILKPSDDVSERDDFIFREAEEHFVSEGGYKLSRGLRAFGESVEGGVFADLGASTGGFTDCLLQSGAKRVYCVDVGESLLDKSLAGDPRVVAMENTNARYLKRGNFPEHLDGVVSDLSFISLRLVLPAVKDLLEKDGRAFVLFKPQFECNGKNLGKSGILPRARHKQLLKDFYAFACAMSLAPENIVNAPVKPKKNVEYVVFLRKEGVPVPESDFLDRADRLWEEK